MSTADLSSNWQISNDDLVDDTEFALAASGFGPYEDEAFYAQVATVGDRIYKLHLNRGVRGTFVFGFESNVEGTLQGVTVSIACTGEFSMYLMRYLDLKRLTTDKDATGWAQAAAIRDTLMAAYTAVRDLAAARDLI